MTVERAAGDGNAFTELGVEPALVDLLERETAEAVDGVHQPDIFLEKGVGFHCSCGMVTQIYSN